MNCLKLWETFTRNNFKIAKHIFHSSNGVSTMYWCTVCKQHSSHINYRNAHLHINTLCSTHAVTDTAKPKDTTMQGKENLVIKNKNLCQVNCKGHNGANTSHLIVSSTHWAQYLPFVIKKKVGKNEVKWTEKS